MCVQYLETGEDLERWNKTKNVARYVLINFENWLRQYETSVVAPLQASPTNEGASRRGVSRPTEIKALSKYLAQIAMKDKETWVQVVMTLERQLDQQEHMVLATWRASRKYGKDKEIICYKLHGKTWAYHTMSGIFRELVNRVAAMYIIFQNR